MSKDNRAGDPGSQPDHSSAKRIVFLFIFILAVALAFSVPLLKKIESVIDNSPAPGYMTFNASRYFFRVDCPETYVVNKEANGFLLDRETGLVAEIRPSHTVASEDLLAHVDDETGIVISFFYKASDEAGLAGATLGKVAEYYSEALKSGLLRNDYTDFVFSGVDVINVGNQNNDMYARDFTFADGGGRLSGTFYCAARPAAVYLICVVYEDGDIYAEYADEISEMIRSFRLTVLKD
jgi:hypothetical protein